MGEPADIPQIPNPKRMVTDYLILVLALSSIFWYIIAVKPQFAIDSGIFQHSMFLLMWCPAIVAIVTLLASQKNIQGFGLKIGELRGWFLAMIIPIVYGLVMYGTAWVTGIAPFLSDKAPVYAPEDAKTRGEL